MFTSAQRNDADASIANLFAMHNRMHDWSYQLGFTESAWNLQAVNLTPAGLGGDAEQGRAQQGALTGNRNNANQGTPRDGLPPTTNMYLWQPQAGGPYPPCVDGDYDMTVIGHEYTHAITNRMIAGPDSGISGHQGGSMGESWGDLLAAEYLFQHGLRAPGETPFITGGYVTGNLVSGIRNYDLSRSPLNYSDIGYNTGGPAVHADGEIWGATNFRVRSALVKRYGLGTPQRQLDCAQGKVAADQCPGNRRWSQLVFDSFLLQAASQVSMLDMRDNMLTADLLRFGGANQDLIWAEFARSGMGRDAATNGATDTDPTPSFASPRGGNATLTLRPRGDSADAPIRVYVGTYEARATPIADTDPATPIPDTVEMVAGTYDLLAVAPGFGHQRLSVVARAGQDGYVDLRMSRNLASTASGATITGDGVNLDRVADDTEATNWASLDGVAGRQLTVALPGGAPQTVKRVNVSAMLRPAIAGDADTGAQNALSALRSFAVSACNATTTDCADPARWQRDLHQRGRRVPRRGVPGVQPGHQPPDVRGAHHRRHPPAARGAGEPVHRRPALRGRAGRRPGHDDGLRDRQPGPDPGPDRRVPGVLEVTPSGPAECPPAPTAPRSAAGRSPHGPARTRDQRCARPHGWPVAPSAGPPGASPVGIPGRGPGQVPQPQQQPHPEEEQQPAEQERGLHHAEPAGLRDRAVGRRRRGVDRVVPHRLIRRRALLLGSARSGLGGLRRGRRRLRRAGRGAARPHHRAGGGLSGQQAQVGVVRLGGEGDPPLGDVLGEGHPVAGGDRAARAERARVELPVGQPGHVTLGPDLQREVAGLLHPVHLHLVEPEALHAAAPSTSAPSRSRRAGPSGRPPRRPSAPARRR